MRTDILAEWLRRETRNLVGFPAQVRILQMSDFLYFILIHKVTDSIEEIPYTNFSKS